MGGCFSHNEAYTVLRSSIVGALIPSEADFLEFFKACKIETHGLKTVLNINQLQSFYVVVTGEVTVCLTPREGKSLVVSSYQPGEIIHFFQNTAISCSGGGILNNTCHLRMNLQFRSPKGSLAQVIGMDRASVDRFLDERPHLSDLKRLLELQLSGFKDVPAFASLALAQINFFGPLLKLRLSFAGEVLRHALDEVTPPTHDVITPYRRKPGAQHRNEGGGHSATSPVSVVRSKLSKLPSIPAKPLALVLCGAYLVAPAEVDADRLPQDYFKGLSNAFTQHSGSSRNSAAIVRTNSGHTLTTSTPLHSRFMSRSNLYSPIIDTTNKSVTSLKEIQQETEGLGVSAEKEQFLQTVQSLALPGGLIYPGALLGLDEYFVKYFSTNSTAGSLAAAESGVMSSEKHFGRLNRKPPWVMSVGMGLIGYLEADVFRAICHFDRRLKRVLHRNYTASLLYAVRPTIPMLQDMEEKTLQQLAGLVSVRQVPRGQTIYRVGQASDSCCIVLTGRVRQIEPVQFMLTDADEDGKTETDSTKHGSTKATSAQEEKLFGPGSLVGEVCMITKAPYYATFIAKTDLVTFISISQRAFDKIFYGDRQKQAEVNVRILGANCDVEHLLSHSLGYSSLMEHLAKEAAQENLLFLLAVVEIEDRWHRLEKEIHALLVSQSYHTWRGHVAGAAAAAQTNKNGTPRNVAIYSLSEDRKKIANATGSALSSTTTPSALQLSENRMLPRQFTDLKVIIEQSREEEEGLSTSPPSHSQVPSYSNDDKEVSTDSVNQRTQSLISSQRSIEVPQVSRSFSERVLPMTIEGEINSTVMVSQTVPDATTITMLTEKTSSMKTAHTIDASSSITQQQHLSPPSTHSVKSEQLVTVTSSPPTLSTHGRTESGRGGDEEDQEEEEDSIDDDMLIISPHLMMHERIPSFIARGTSSSSLPRSKNSSNKSARSARGSIAEAAMKAAFTVSQAAVTALNPNHATMQSGVINDTTGFRPDSPKTSHTVNVTFHASVHSVAGVADNSASPVRNFSVPSSPAATTGSNSTVAGTSPRKLKSTQRGATIGVSSLREFGMERIPEVLSSPPTSSAPVVKKSLVEPLSPATLLRRLQSAPVLSTPTSAITAMSSALQENTAAAADDSSVHRTAQSAKEFRENDHSNSLLVGFIFDKLLLQVQEVRTLITEAIDTFVTVNSPQQVNLPHRMMQQIMHRQEMWGKQTDEMILEAMITHAQTEIARKQHASEHDHHSITSDHHHGPSSIMSGGMSAAVSPTAHGLRSMSIDDAAVSTSVQMYIHLFDAARQEIMHLVRTGPFVRWRMSPAFQSFLQAIKPYDGGQSNNGTPNQHNNDHRRAGSHSVSYTVHSGGSNGDDQSQSTSIAAMSVHPAVLTKQASANRPLNKIPSSSSIAFLGEDGSGTPRNPQNSDNMLVRSFSNLRNAQTTSASPFITEETGLQLACFVVTTGRSMNAIVKASSGVIDRSHAGSKSNSSAGGSPVISFRSAAKGSSNTITGPTPAASYAPGLTSIPSVDSVPSTSPFNALDTKPAAKTSVLSVKRNAVGVEG